MAIVEVTNSGYPAPDLDYFTRFESDQCTWYAYGRMRQINGKTITFKRDYDLHAIHWPDQAKNLTKYSDIKAQSVAIFKGSNSNYGHVVYVYGIQGGQVLFSDHNGGRDYRKVFACPIADFENMCNGYICCLK